MAQWHFVSMPPENFNTLKSSFFREYLFRVLIISNFAVSKGTKARIGNGDTKKLKFNH